MIVRDALATFADAVRAAQHAGGASDLRDRVARALDDLDASLAASVDQAPIAAELRGIAVARSGSALDLRVRVPWGAWERTCHSAPTVVQIALAVSTPQQPLLPGARPKRRPRRARATGPTS